MRKDQCKISNDQLAILNEKHREKLSFTGCDKWMESGGSRSAEVGILLSFIAN